MPFLEPFIDELPLPSRVRPTGTGHDLRLTIAARAVPAQFHSALPVAVAWSYQLVDGTVLQPSSGASYLGPTIDVRRGQRVSVLWRNEIAADVGLPFTAVKVPNANARTTRPVPQNEPGTLGALGDAQDMTRAALHTLRAALVTHLHGGRTPASADGWTEDTMTSGQETRYLYPNEQPAAMLWYHDHAMHATRLNVYAGLAGVWLIRDAEEAALDLPTGLYELPLVIQDRNLDLEAAGNYSGALLHKTEVGDGPMEFFGPYTLVNGKIWPKATLVPRLYRLRILNGSNARTYRLVLLDGAGRRVHDIARLIGGDQGLTERATTLSSDGLILAPAERVDLLVDFSGRGGESLYLWNTAEAPYSTDTDGVDEHTLMAELRSLNRDARSSAAAVNPRAEQGRRPFPQVMRFDVRPTAMQYTGTQRAPGERLWSTSRVALDVTPDTKVRVVALVEEPAAADGAPDATSMLAFWELISADDEPPPANTPLVSVSYFHPGTRSMTTKCFWKGASRFYDRINWHVTLDTTELWYIVNLSPDMHPIHVHLTQIDVQQRWKATWNGTGELDPTAAELTRIEPTTPLPIDPDMRVPKDTVRVYPGEMAGIVLRFAPYAGRYMYHCHILEHEDHDMMRPFVIAPPWIHHDMR